MKIHKLFLTIMVCSSLLSLGTAPVEAKETYSNNIKLIAPDLQSETPDFTNEEAWVTENPYAKSGFYGQSTWFAWGRFYEMYGYSPSFTGSGARCIGQLLEAHISDFSLSKNPYAGAIGSSTRFDHLFVVVGVKGNKVTIQEANVNGIEWNYPFSQSGSTANGWHTVTYTKKQLKKLYRPVYVAPIYQILHNEENVS